MTGWARLEPIHGFDTTSAVGIEVDGLDSGTCWRSRLLGCFHWSRHCRRGWTTGPLGAADDPAVSGAPRLFAGVNTHALHAPRIGVEDFDLELARTRDQFAAHRHAADQRDDVPR